MEDWSSAVVDILGNIYLCGPTSSAGGTVIATPCTYQDGYGGGARDAFLAKFSSTGTRLWGTYYGGLGREDYGICATDNSGNIYLGGSTTSLTASNIIASTGS